MLCLIANKSMSQVGINTTTPSSLFEVKASNTSNPSINDGVIIPRVNTFPSANPGVEQNGMLIYLTNAVGIKERGFYYWDNPTLSWLPIAPEEWKSGVNSGGTNLIYATRAQALGNDFVFTNDGKIGIGTKTPVERFELRGPGDNDMQITSASTNPPNFIFYNTGGTLDAPNALGTDQEIGSIIMKTHDGVTMRENGGFRFFMDGTPSVGNVPSKFIISTTPSGGSVDVTRLVVRSTGNVGIGLDNPQAKLHLTAGSASANSAPFKFSSGTSLTTPEAGAMEYDGSSLYFTPSASKRQRMFMGYSTTTNLDFTSIASRTSSDLTVTVNGASIGNSCQCAPNSIIETGLMWNCFVSNTNTVTIRLYNGNGTDLDPASRTWKVVVID